MNDKRRHLPKAPARRGLGLPTIMNPALAAAHGVSYVHLAAFAIDVDRVREEAEETEGYDNPRPFGWEVFLCERYLVERFDPNRRPEDVAFLEEVVLSILEGEPDARGGQLAFAIWAAIARGAFPKRLEAAFDTWKERPDELVGDLAEMWKSADELSARLADGCFAVALEPPLAPPTIAALEAMRAPAPAPAEG